LDSLRIRKYVFFFSSRRRHTRWPRDWSSDVCSSDLIGRAAPVRISSACAPSAPSLRKRHPSCASPSRSPGRSDHGSGGAASSVRSEERRVGKSVDVGGRRSIKKIKGNKRDKSVHNKY